MCPSARFRSMLEPDRLAMSEENIKNLWGYRFRVVQEGLAEADVVPFVERLMGQYQACLERLEHIGTLHELARQAVQQAEAMAAKIKEEAKHEAEKEFARVIAKAMNQAQEIVEKAERDAHERLTRADEQAREVLAKAEGEAKAMADKLVQELTNAAIQNFIRELEATTPKKQPVPGDRSGAEAA